MFKCGYLSHGLVIDTNSSILPCCHISRNAHFCFPEKHGDILNSTYLKNIRLKAINGEVPDICNQCVENEKITGSSARTRANGIIPSNNINEIALPEDINYLQIRLSNVCNFKCIICNPTHSHLIGKEKKRKNPLLELDKDFYNQLKEILPKMKNLNLVIFAGGEPLYNASKLNELLDYIPKTTEIATHTNGSNFNKEIFDKFKSFKKIALSFSIDASDRFFEYQRTNGKWDQVLENIKRIKKEYPTFNLDCNISVSCITLTDIPNLLKETEGLFRNIKYNFIHSPKYYQINVLKPEVLKEVNKQIKDDIFNKTVANAILNPASDKIIKQFWNYTNYLRVNRIDIYDYIPEIEELICKK